MGLRLIEATRHESRLEHMVVLKAFAEGRLLGPLPFMSIASGGIFNMPSRPSCPPWAYAS